MIVVIGLILNRNVATNAAMNKAKLFQSIKFSGVARLSAAVPIRPRVAGFNPDIIP